MSADAGDEELERLKAAKMAELQRRMAEEEERLRREAERQAAMRVILTPEARQRLANLRLVKPELVAQLEEQLIQLANSGRVPLPITDEMLKEILARITSKREIRIRRL
ncbi:MAG: DNA-binding protein [Aigarchaeota archaeon]|jgi:programmed cell death protein 5|nr:DNA-binding protein [Candidatus Wolframiiraptor gerlachensis]